MGYCNDDAMVRVDFFKPSGKWYCTEAVRWTGRYQHELIHSAFHKSLKDHFKGSGRLVGMTAVCLEPYHEYAHPLMVRVEEN